MEVKDVDFNPEFITRMLPRLEWGALVATAQKVLPEDFLCFLSRHFTKGLVSLYLEQLPIRDYNNLSLPFDYIHTNHVWSPLRRYCNNLFARNWEIDTSEANPEKELR